MNVLIINQYCENRGDEAAGTALVRNLLKIKTIDRIDIIYNSAYQLDLNDSRVFHRNEDLRLKKIGKRGIIQYLLFKKTIFSKYCYANETIKEMIETIRRADYIYVTPCGASIGIYRDWAFLIRLLFVILENKTPIFCLNTIGASGNKIFDVISRFVLNRSVIYVREQRSFEYLKQIGINSKLGVDTAFSLEPIVEKRKSNHVGLVVTKLEWHPEFKGRNMELEILQNIIPGVASFCILNNYAIDIIPHTDQIDEKQYIEKVKKTLEAAGMKSEMIFERNEIKTSTEYDKAIAAEHMVIGMRYHSIVLAAKNCIPFLALAYENKMKEVSSYTGCLNFCLDLQKPIFPTEIVKKLQQIEENYSDIEERLKNEYYTKLTHLSRLPLEMIDM